jgi:peroxiredoxin
MAKMQKGTTAPSFTLTDTLGQVVTLSEYQGKKHVVLVLNRGFV